MNTLGRREIEMLVARAINSAHDDLPPSLIVEAGCEGCHALVRREAFRLLREQLKNQRESQKRKSGELAA